MERREEIEATAGVGLVGDRYANRTGTYSDANHEPRDVTLIEREAIEGARAEYGIELAEHETRRNLVTEGVPLNHLVGRTFRVGTVRMRGVTLAEPCVYLERLTRDGVRLPLVHRGGLQAEITVGGVIHVDDIIEAE
jgi:MOSC domain-containing protein YiiM